MAFLTLFLKFTLVCTWRTGPPFPLAIQEGPRYTALLQGKVEDGFSCLQEHKRKVKHLDRTLPTLHIRHHLPWYFQPVPTLKEFGGRLIQPEESWGSFQLLLTGSAFLQDTSHLGNGSSSQLALVPMTAGASSVQELQLWGCLWSDASQKQDREAWLDQSDLSEGLLAFRTDGPPGLRALADAPGFHVHLLCIRGAA